MNRVGVAAGRIGIASGNAGRHILAGTAIAAGETVLNIVGVTATTASRYSVQAGPELHVAPPELAEDDPAERYWWRFLNHSCAPNARLRGLELVALRAIAAGEEITFDYNCTEYDMAEPFVCRCGHCKGELIRGFKHLSPAEQCRRTAWAADYLLALAGVVDPSA